MKPKRIPDSSFTALETNQAKDLWRGCEAWMVTPMITVIPQAEGNEVLKFDVKGGGHMIIDDPEGAKYKAAFPNGLFFGDSTMKNMCRSLTDSTNMLVDLAIFDYSVYLAVTEQVEGGGPCKASSDTLVYSAQAFKAGESKAHAMCVAIGVIDYLGHPATKAMRRLLTHALFRDTSLKFRNTFMAGILQCKSSDNSAMLKNKLFI